MTLDIATKENSAKQLVPTRCIESTKHALLLQLAEKDHTLHPAVRQQSSLADNDSTSFDTHIESHARVHVPMTLPDRILELTKSNSFLHDDNGVVSLLDCDRCSVTAGSITLLDHFIAQQGGTTSTFEKLPHQLQAAKRNSPQTMAQRESELLHVNKYLIVELEYHHKVRVLERRFFNTIHEVRSLVQKILTTIKFSNETREVVHAQARSILLDFCGIESFDSDGDSIAI